MARGQAVLELLNRYRSDCGASAGSTCGEERLDRFCFCTVRRRKVALVTGTLIATRPADLSRGFQVVEVVDLLDEAAQRFEQASIYSLPRVLHDVSTIERHVLSCVATHCWTHQGSIPYRPPTAHQAVIADALAGPTMRLLTRVATRRPTYILSRLGESVTRRVLHVVCALEDRVGEREFDRMRALMRNDWETIDWEAHEVAVGEEAS